MLTWSILILATVIILFYLKRKDLPGPKGLPIVGSSFSVTNPHFLHKYLEDWADQYGPLYEVSIFGSRMVIVSDLNTFQKILNNRPNGWRRVSTFQPIAIEAGIHGVFSAEGESWKRQRKLTAPAFTNLKVKGHYDFIATVCERMRRKWTNAIKKQANPEEGLVINVLADMMNFTLDVISMIAFGYDLNSLENHSPTVEHLLSVLPFVYKRMTSLVPYWKLYHTPIDKAYYKSFPELRSLVKEIIEKNQNEKMDESAKKNFIEVILQARQLGEDHLSDDEIVGNVLTLLLAGQDTTANTLSWCMYYLSRNHQIQELVFDDALTAAIDPRKTVESWYLPDKNQVSNLQFTQNVVNEVLRIRGPSPLMFLSPTSTPQAVESGIEKTTVRVKDSVILLNRKIAINHFGKSFNPRRWDTADEAEKELLKTISNVPFGGGPRICPGKHLSLYESTLFLSMLANNFIVRTAESKSKAMDESLASTEAQDIKEAVEFTMAPVGLRLRIFLRNDE